MVKLHVKRGDEGLFLYETNSEVLLHDLVRDVTSIYNGRLKIKRICEDIQELVQHGPSLPLDIPENSKEEASTLRSKRSGEAPPINMAEVLTRSVCEARSAMSNESISAGCCMTLDAIRDSLDSLRAAVDVAYPQGLPITDPIRRELETREIIEGVPSDPDVIHLESAELWWAGKVLESNRKLSEYVGKNEKTKIIVKLQKKGNGPPSREPVMTEEQRRQYMLATHHRQQELQRLEEDDDDSYLNSNWADQQSLKRTFHGVENIKWSPR